MDKELLINSLLEVVDTQIANGDPPATKRTYQRLVKLGYSQADAKKLIASCIFITMNAMIDTGTTFNEGTLEDLLNKLPELPAI